MAGQHREEQTDAFAMASTFDTLYADMMDTFLQVAVGIGMATPTAEADR